MKEKKDIKVSILIAPVGTYCVIDDTKKKNVWIDRVWAFQVETKIIEDKSGNFATSSMWPICGDFEDGYERSNPHSCFVGTKEECKKVFEKYK